jgi:hypothetical protein
MSRSLRTFRIYNGVVSDITQEEIIKNLNKGELYEYRMSQNSRVSRKPQILFFHLI